MSLVEVLVVIAVVGTLLGLVVPAVLHMREAAHRSSCLNNLRQLGIAVSAYHGANETMPPYATGWPYGSWFTYLIPHLDVGQFPQPDRMEASAFGEHLQFKCLICKSDPTAYWDAPLAKTSYQGNWFAFGGGKGGGDTPWFPPAQSFGDLTNGTSNVVLFADSYSDCQLTRLATDVAYLHTFGITQDGKPSDDPSYAPDDYTMFQVRPTTTVSGPRKCDKLRTQTPHSTMNVGLADGSVRSLRPDISPDTWKHIIKPNSGPAPDNW